MWIRVQSYSIYCVHGSTSVSSCFSPSLTFTEISKLWSPLQVYKMLKHEDLWNQLQLLLPQLLLGLQLTFMASLSLSHYWFPSPLLSTSVQTSCLLGRVAQSFISEGCKSSIVLPFLNCGFCSFPFTVIMERKSTKRCPREAPRYRTVLLPARHCVTTSFPYVVMGSVRTANIIMPFLAWCSTETRSPQMARW